VTRGGRFVSARELAQLLELHCHLRERFARHLELLRNRANGKAVKS
jgi:hypothetical protein